MINTPLSIWSYAPSTMEGVSVDTDATDATGKLYPQLNTFSYTVPTDLQDQNDLLFAYNTETRQFDNSGEFAPSTQSQAFKVHFYHALAAVKFVLAPVEGTTGLPSGTKTISKGVDIRKITVTGVIADGTCEISSTSSEGSGTVSFDWTPGTTTKDFIFEFDPSDPKYLGRKNGATGFCSAEDGVMFMIPQNLTDVKVTVEFMKFNEPYYVARRTRSISTTEWEAGKCYTYELAGEIHVPGEILPSPAEMYHKGFHFGAYDNIFDSNISVKGVKKVGLILSKMDTKDNSATVFTMLATDGTIPNPMPSQSNFDFNFKGVDVSSPANPEKIYRFGNDTTPETYHTYYEIDLNPTGTKTGPFYYVFDVDVMNQFNIGYNGNSNNSSSYIRGYIWGFIVLEVQND